MTTQSLQCMRAGKIQLDKVETEIFQERLKYLTPRQADLNFEQLIEKFKEQKKIHDEKLSQEQKEEEKRHADSGTSEYRTLWDAAFFSFVERRLSSPLMY